MSETSPAHGSGGPSERSRSERSTLARQPRRLAALGIGEPRRRILAAAIETVARRGYRRSTVSRIAAIAGVPESDFREHFNDVEECFEAALDALLREAEGLVLRSFDEPAQWPQRVRAALSALLAAIADYPDGAMAAVVESFAASETARERYRATLGLLASLLDQGRPLARHPESLTEQTADAIVGGIAAIVHRRVLEGNAAELPLLLDEITFFALMPWLGHEDALRAAGLERD